MIQIRTIQIDAIGHEDFREVAPGTFYSRKRGVVVVADGGEAMEVTIGRRQEEEVEEYDIEATMRALIAENEAANALLPPKKTTARSRRH